MSKKYKKQRSHVPGWVDELIGFLEVVGAIGTVLAGIYALVTWVI